MEYSTESKLFLSRLSSFRCISNNRSVLSLQISGRKASTETEEQSEILQLDIMEFTVTILLVTFA